MVIVLALAGWIYSRDTSPEVDGRRVNEWLASTFYFKDKVFLNVRTAEFDRAMEKAGTNALPMILEKIRTRDFPHHGPTWTLLKRLGMDNPSSSLLHWLLLDRAYIAHERGYNGMRAIGAAATNAIPDLIRLGEREPLVALKALSCIGPEKLTLLRQYALNGSVESRRRAMHALETRSLDSRLEEVVDVWIECLKDESRVIRHRAAVLLKNATPARAQAAVPALKIASSDVDANVAAAAKIALEKLAPAVADE